jgi:hypothetical protein
MSDTLRLLNAEGRQTFSDYLRSTVGGSTVHPPIGSLIDSTTSVAAPLDIAIHREPFGRPFASRHEFGLYLRETLAPLPRNAISLDHRLWNWLSLYFIDQLAPLQADGKRKLLKDTSAYLLDEKFVWRRYYRHLVRGPWLAASLHPDHSRALLLPLERGTPLAVRGELYEQIASRQSLLRSPAVMAAVDAMYFDAATMTRKAGSGGSGAGSPRRLGSLMNQFALTYDLEWDDRSLIPRLLPKEFSRWTKR